MNSSHFKLLITNFLNLLNILQAKKEEFVGHKGSPGYQLVSCGLDSVGLVIAYRLREEPWWVRGSCGKVAVLGGGCVSEKQ